MIEEKLDPLNEEIITDRNCEKPQTEIRTYESLEELKYPQEQDFDCLILYI